MQTITLPETTFQRLLQRSSFTHRSISDEAARIVATALPAKEDKNGGNHSAP